MSDVSAEALTALGAPDPDLDFAALFDALPADSAEGLRAYLRELGAIAERYRRLIETTSDAIVITDRARVVTFANAAAHLLFGRPGEELIGTPVASLVTPELRANVARSEDAAFAGESQRYETVVLRPDGECRTVSVSTSPLRDGETINGIVATLRDITEERRLSEELMQHEKLAAIGQLVSGVAHELNNPLAGIMAFAQLIEGSPELGAELRDAVDTIQKEARRAAKIVANLLLFARQRHPERVSTDINRVVLDTLELRAYVLRTRQVEVLTELDRTLPPTWADPFQLQQVMLNLITNAEHAVSAQVSPKRIALRTRRAGDRLVITVSDSGPGIAAEHIDRIFNPFFTTKGVGEGTGLGLSISHGIVRQHGGELRVRSAPGQGATFEIELPLLQPPETESVDEPESEPPVATPRTFLLVDDEPAIRAALAKHLERQGHTADAVATGAEALALLRTRRYDGIFLDLRMPDLGGEELFETLRANDPAHAARVVFATGDVESDGARRFLREAGRPFVGKPFALGTVATLLAKVAAS